MVLQKDPKSKLGEGNNSGKVQDQENEMLKQRGLTERMVAQVNQERTRAQIEKEAADVARLEAEQVRK